MNGDSLLFSTSPRTSILGDFSSRAANDPNANDPQAPLTLQGITFAASAPSYTIELYSDVAGSLVYNANLAFSGSGVTNASGQTQTFVIDAGTVGMNAPAAPPSTITFNNNAAAGTATYMLKGGEAVPLDPQPGILRSSPGAIFFNNNASASTGTFISNGGAGNGATGARVEFHGTFTPGAGNSTAGTATFTNKAGRLGPTFNSGQPVAGFGGETIFFDNTTAGSAHFTNEAEADKAGSGSGGLTLFQGNANADHGVFVSNASTSSSGVGGDTSFAGSASAGFGTFTNNASATSLEPTGGGLTGFFETATADHGSFTNSGGDGVGGLTFFRDTSTAGNGSFTNLGTTGSFGAAIPGETRFLDNSNAGNGTFTNKPGTSTGGMTEFFNSSSAAHGTFINDGTGGGSAAGMVIFHDTSTAANGQFSTQGNAGGQFVFKDGSTAGSATFTVGTDTSNARLEFHNQSTAASAMIDVRARGNLLFFDTSNGANSMITVRAAVEGGLPGGGGGFVVVNGTSASLGSAIVDVQGGTVNNNGGGGQVAVENPGSTADNAIITTEGGIVAGSFGATTTFYSGATAGNAILITNGGTHGGGGGTTSFTSGALGGTARLITNAGGVADFSGNLNFGTSVGSIEGAGTYMLGGSLLTTGSRNISTVVSGTIIDGPGTAKGGQLTVVGSGTLTLSGANTYTGATNIGNGMTANSGKLIAANTTGSATGTGPVFVDKGGTLGGSGFIAGPVTLKAGGTISPGDPVTLTLQNTLTWDGGGTIRLVLGPDQASSDLLKIVGALIRGDPSGGQFQFDLINGGAVVGQTYDFLHFGSIQGFSAADFTVTGDVGGTFNIQNGAIGFTATSVVPEPSTYLLFLCGLVLLACRRRGVGACSRFQLRSRDRTP